MSIKGKKVLEEIVKAHLEEKVDYYESLFTKVQSLFTVTHISPQLNPEPKSEDRLIEERDLIL
jgi:hypothetical protein